MGSMGKGVGEMGMGSMGMGMEEMGMLVGVGVGEMGKEYVARSGWGRW
jgi:hypothetical protein